MNAAADTGVPMGRTNTRGWGTVPIEKARDIEKGGVARGRMKSHHDDTALLHFVPLSLPRSALSLSLLTFGERATKKFHLVQFCKRPRSRHSIWFFSFTSSGVVEGTTTVPPSPQAIYVRVFDLPCTEESRTRTHTRTHTFQRAVVPPSLR